MALLAGLFVVGGLIGWFVRNPSDGGERTTRIRSPQHQTHLESQIEKLESEVDSARRGASNSGVSSSPHSSAAKSPDPSDPPGVSAGKRLAGVTVVVDPGHNGGNASHPEEIDRPVVSAADGTTKPCNTTGTETNDGALTEAEFNFEVSVDLKRDLHELGATVVMTRDSNTGIGPCVNERAEIANRAGASAAISIHADGNDADGAHGFDVIHASPDEMVEPALAEPSLVLAERVRDALVSAGVPPANYVGHDGLDSRSDLGGLNLARVPAVLVELGNMRSAEEAAQMETSRYRARLAQALVAGVADFLEEAQS